MSNQVQPGVVVHVTFLDLSVPPVKGIWMGAVQPHVFGVPMIILQDENDGQIAYINATAVKSIHRGNGSQPDAGE